MKTVYNSKFPYTKLIMGLNKTTNPKTVAVEPNKACKIFTTFAS